MQHLALCTVVLLAFAVRLLAGDTIPPAAIDDLCDASHRFAATAITRSKMPAGFGNAIDVVNVAPVVASAISAQTGFVGTACNYTVPAGTFTDADGDPLTWSASGLPTGLQFTAATHGIAGTPTAARTSIVTISVDDGQGHTTSTTFSFIIASGAPSLTTPIPDQIATANAAFAYTVPAGAFTSPNGNPLSWSTSTLPAWLAFNGVTHAFSGIPDAVGATSITVTVGNGRGTVHDAFIILVGSPANDAPVVVHHVHDQQVKVGMAFSYVIPLQTIIDPDGDALTWTVTGLPAWLNFDAGTRTISGTCPDPEGSGMVSNPHPTVTAADSHGTSASDGFVILVVPGGASRVSHGSGSGGGGCGLSGGIGLLGIGCALALTGRGRRRADAAR